MTERAAILGAALLLVALALLAMVSMHDKHYKSRRMQMFEGRLSSLERIIGGDHD